MMNKKVVVKYFFQKDDLFRLCVDETRNNTVEHITQYKNFRGVSQIKHGLYTLYSTNTPLKTLYETGAYDYIHVSPIFSDRLSDFSNLCRSLGVSYLIMLNDLDWFTRAPTRNVDVRVLFVKKSNSFVKYDVLSTKLSLHSGNLHTDFTETYNLTIEELEKCCKEHLFIVTWNKCDFRISKTNNLHIELETFFKNYAACFSILIIAIDEVKILAKKAGANVNTTNELFEIAFGLQVFVFLRKISELSGVSFDDICRKKIVDITAFVLKTSFVSHGYWPKTPDLNWDSDVEVEGGLVLDCIPTKKQVAIFDFFMLYPSVISVFNLGIGSTIVINNGSFDQDKLAYKPIQISGKYYSSLRCPRSPLALLIDKFICERKENAGIRPIANVFKMIANITTGLLSTERGRFLGGKVTAAIITSHGRKILQITRDEFLYEGFRVVGGDTDSIMAEISTEKNNECHIIAAQIVKNCKLYGFTLKFEEIFSTFISRKRKRYIGITTSKQVVIKGIRRSISSDFHNVVKDIVLFTVNEAHTLNDVAEKIAELSYHHEKFMTYSPSFLEPSGLNSDCVNYRSKTLTYPVNARYILTSPNPYIFHDLLTHKFDNKDSHKLFAKLVKKIRKYQTLLFLQQTHPNCKALFLFKQSATIGRLYVENGEDDLMFPNICLNFSKNKESALEIKLSVSDNLIYIDPPIFSNVTYRLSHPMTNSVTDFIIGAVISGLINSCDKNIYKVMKFLNNSNDVYCIATTCGLYLFQNTSFVEYIDFTLR